MPVSWPKGSHPIIGKGEYLRYRMAIDPICKMTVDEKTAKFTSEYKGKKYYFLCLGLQKEVRHGPGEIRMSIR
jgi:YHS domain-containing protein